MTWVRHSDKTHRDEALVLAGRDGKLLWYDAMGECAAFDDGAGRDGMLTMPMVRAAAVLSDPFLPYKRLAPKLVELGLWHDGATVAGCVACMARGGDSLPEGAYLIHQWWEHLLTSAGKHDGIVRDHERRGKRLDRHPELTAMVRKRDRDLCRYCGILTRWDGDRRSKVAGTFDHIDPFGGNSLANVVVACKRCNGVKKDRTPEQAGMEKLPVPDPYQPTDQATGTDQINPDQALARETGPGQVGDRSDRTTGPGSAPDRVLVETELTPALSSNGHTNGNGKGPDHA